MVEGKEKNQVLTKHLEENIIAENLHTNYLSKNKNE
jgi:hypothetical protein